MAAPVALTFTRGRGFTPTVETNAPVREAGQFAEYESCPIRNSGSHRVAFPLGTKVTAARGGLIVYLSPDYAHDSGSLGSLGRVFQVGTGDNWVVGRYDKGNKRFMINRGVSTAAQYIYLFSAAEPLAVYFAWDDDTIYCAANGGVIGTQPNANTGITLDGTIHIGTDDAGGNYLDFAAAAVVILDGPITQAQWEALAALRAERPPAYGEGGLGAAMTGLWYGAAREVMSVPANGGTALDLNDHSGQTLLLSRLLGAGVAPSQHRVVDTPLRNGAVYVTTKVALRRLVAEVSAVSRSTGAALQARRRTLAAALNPARGQGVLTYAPAGRLYEVTALVDQEGIALGDETVLIARAAIPFMCSDPAWRDVVAQQDAEESSGEGAAFPSDFPTDFLAGEQFTVENGGDLAAWPKVTIDGPVAAPFIRNVTSGKRFALTAAIASGQSVEIDMDARTVVRSDGTNLMPARTADSEMWALEPGENTLEAGYESAAAVPVVFTIQHAPQFVGV